MKQGFMYNQSEIAATIEGNEEPAALHNNLNRFEIELIQKAFKKCWYLKSLLIKENKEALAQLASETGMRRDFIIEHLEEIKNL